MPFRDVVKESSCPGPNRHEDACSQDLGWRAQHREEGRDRRRESSGLKLCRRQAGGPSAGLGLLSSRLGASEAAPGFARLLNDDLRSGGGTRAPLA